MKQGFVHVYTGNGKGKTTAALGLAFRAVGHGMKVLMIQFMKRDLLCGELKSAKKLSPFLVIKQTGQKNFVSKKKPGSRNLKLARDGFNLAQKAIQSRSYDLVILDEINPAVDFGLIPVSELLLLIESKPMSIELVLTGRNAHPDIMRKADLVTEMVERKHYYREGIRARKGIEK